MEVCSILHVWNNETNLEATALVYLATSSFPSYYAYIKAALSYKLPFICKALQYFLSAQPFSLSTLTSLLAAHHLLAPNHYQYISPCFLLFFLKRSLYLFTFTISAMTSPFYHHLPGALWLPTQRAKRSTDILFHIAAFGKTFHDHHSSKSSLESHTCTFKVAKVWNHAHLLPPHLHLWQCQNCIYTDDLLQLLHFYLNLQPQGA